MLKRKYLTETQATASIFVMVLLLFIPTFIILEVFGIETAVVYLSFITLTYSAFIYSFYLKKWKEWKVSE